MPDYEMNQQGKKVLQMTREGLTKEDSITGESENVSHKKTDCELHQNESLETAYGGMKQNEYFDSLISYSEDEPEEAEETYKSSYYIEYSPFNIKEQVENALSEYQEAKYYENKRRYGRSRESLKLDAETDAKEFKRSTENNNIDKFNREISDSKKNEYRSETNGNSIDKFKRDLLGEKDKFKNDSAGKKNSKEKESRSEKQFRKLDRKIERVDKKAEKLIAKKTRTRLKYDRTEKRLKYEKVPIISKEKIEASIDMRPAKKFWNTWAKGRRQNRDMIPGTMMSSTRKGYRYVRNINRNLTRSVKTIERHIGSQARLNRAENKAAEYRLRKDELEYKRMSPEHKRAQKNLQKQINKKRFQKVSIKKNMLQSQQRVVRHRSFIVKVKDNVKKVIEATKTVMSLVGAVSTVIIVICLLFFGGFFLAAICFSYGSNAVLEGTYKADYGQISGCSAYMKKLETDLEEMISKIEDENSEYAGCFEYNYDELGEIGHDPIGLMSYLAAKFVEFDLEKCREELDSLFEEMYTLTIEVIQEARERELSNEEGNIIYDEEGNPVMETFMADICYVTLEVKPLGKIIAERLNDEQKKYYDVYMLSSGGQQVYANCLPGVNWEGLISSRFGERIHPITEKRTFHKGVDIAVPTGTPLYSSAAGIVTTSAYSETAGHYIIVTMENGWKITYMHLDSRNVSVGTEVIKGQFLGETGNSGKSTGPHLHLEIKDENDNPIDPTFMIPSNSVIVKEGDKR